MGRKWLLAVGVCVGLVLLLAGTGQAQSKAGEAKTLRIGSLKALTGFYSFYDGADAMDVKILASIINKKGGIAIKGQRYNIEIVEEDIKSTLEGTTAAATKLAFDKKVRFAVGPAGFYGPAAAAVFNPNKVMYVLDTPPVNPASWVLTDSWAV